MATEDEINITLERLRTMPRSIKLNIGMSGSFTRDELLQAVKDKTELGCMVVDMQMAYVRSFKERVK